MRKPIQISIGASEEVDTYIVLCDDNSIWRAYSNEPGWQRIEDIPQDTETTKGE